MKNPKNENTCKECNKQSDVLVDGICIRCFESKQEERGENPLDKFEFEKDEFEEIQDEYIKKDIKKENSENMIVHPRPNTERAIDKIIKVIKNRRK